jgi:hypothetical protein
MMRCGGTDGYRRCDIFDSNSGNLIADFGKLEITDLMRYARSFVELEVPGK